MGYTFPDVREALFALVPLAVDGVTPYFQLTIDWEQTLADSPAVLISRVGGAQSGPFRQDRMQVDVYAIGSARANDVAQQICTFLADSSHSVPLPPDPTQDGAPTEVLLDLVEVEVIPTEIPYMSDTVNIVSATYRVDTRAT
ncbi:MAG TPA: hypothetical protein VGF17_17000 [Phytomonospora sp.]|nr:hypothetical protein [Streptomycetaceae bacterium]